MDFSTVSWIVFLALLSFCVQEISSKITNKETLSSNVVLPHRGEQLVIHNTSALYGPWSPWSRCSRDCTQDRTRECINRDICGNSRVKATRQCEQVPSTTPGQKRCHPAARRQRWGLPKRLEDILSEYLYDEWSHWSRCTRTCKRRRFRECALWAFCKHTILVEERKCHVPGTACDRNRDKDREQEIDVSSENEWEVEEPQVPEREVSTPEYNHTTVDYDPDTCGQRAATPSLRIVGGREATRGSWPWQVAVLTRWHEQYCGGVLVAPNWILTAAHCLRKNGRRRKILLRTGEHDLSQDEGPEIDHKPFREFVHKDFDMTTIDSDIALVKLEQPVEKGEYIDFACLPEEEDELPANTLCYAIGWGKMKNTHLYGTDVLRQAKVPLITDKKCQGAFEYEITENQMCAGYKRGGIDTCAGDSGGPLMCEITKDGVSRWYAYGVTSFGEGCGDRGKYGIYTKVKNFSKWIQNIIRNN